MLPVQGLSSLGLSGVTWDHWQLELRILDFLLHQWSNIDAKLWVQLLFPRIQDIVVKATLFHDAPTGFHRDPDTQVDAQNLTEERPSHDIGFHSDQGVLHWEASLTALSVCFLMEQAFMIFVRLLGSLGSKRLLYSASEIILLLICQHHRRVELSCLQRHNRPVLHA